MMRDELLQRLAALPEDSDVGVQIGDDYLDITDVVPWGDGSFGALRCHSSDLRDMGPCPRILDTGFMRLTPA